MTKVASWKKNKVEEIKKLLTEYPVIGIVDLTNLPSAQFQKIRHSLRDSVLIKMTRARLVKIAIDQLKDKKKNIEELNKIMTGMSALLLTKTDAFKLSMSLSKSKSKAPAKPGQKAPNNIVIPAGPTPFAPGPVMGELGQLGIKTSVVDGKITVKEDKLLVKTDEIISDKVASLLSKLKIEPMEIGINLLAVYDSGLIYGRDVLSIDEKAYLNNLILAYNESLNLSMFISYPTKENINLLIRKAYIDAKSLADSRNITLNTEKAEIRSQTKEEIFKSEEVAAKEVLSKLQEERIKHPVHVHVEEPKINKGPKIEDLVPKDYT